MYQACQYLCGRLSRPAPEHLQSLHAAAHGARVVSGQTLITSCLQRHSLQRRALVTWGMLSWALPCQHRIHVRLLPSQKDQQVCLEMQRLQRTGPAEPSHTCIPWQRMCAGLYAAYDSHSCMHHILSSCPFPSSCMAAGPQSTRPLGGQALQPAPSAPATEFPSAMQVRCMAYLVGHTGLLRATCCTRLPPSAILHLLAVCLVLDCA